MSSNHLIVAKRNRYIMTEHPTRRPIRIDDDASCLELERMLEDRVYEFNVEATGYADGKLFAFALLDDRGDFIAGINGHTWGGCCEVTNLWVHQDHRRSGFGRSLMQSAEAEAVRRGCTLMTLFTHSFQAPEFYARLGFERRFAIDGRPRGHSDMCFVKHLE